MKAKVLIPVVIITIAVAACSKDKFTAKPQLELKSVSTTTLVKEQILQFVFRVTDKDGDLQDTIFVQRISKVCPELRTDDPERWPMPKFTPRNNLDAEITITYGYKSSTFPPPVIDGCVQKNDTSYFRFWIKDTKQNVSDTVSSQEIAFIN